MKNGSYMGVVRGNTIVLEEVSSPVVDVLAGRLGGHGGVVGRAIGVASEMGGVGCDLGLSGAADTGKMTTEANHSIGHDIGWAVKQMYAKKRVTRRGWNGKNMWVRITTPDRTLSDDGGWRGSYPEMKTVDNNLVPWLCSVTDLFANDWIVIE